MPSVLSSPRDHGRRGKDCMPYVPGHGVRSLFQGTVISRRRQSTGCLVNKGDAMRIVNYVGLEQRGSQKWAVMVKAVLTIGTALLGSIATTPMTAQVQLPTVNLEDTNFEDGFAGPGLLLEEFPDVYVADTLKDSNAGAGSLVVATSVTGIARA